ncbi:hypothetical protein Pfo_023345 [Paulownia fortunei]|nr:hypothetical protein Pfo_023345 [Paulownia fortunei]
MAFVRLANTLVLLQLSLVLCSSIVAHGDETETLAHYPPAEAPHPPPPHHHHHPIKPPVHPPVKPPSYPPVKPPSYPPPRKMVYVQGVVYCKSCKYRGVDTLLEAAPLSGAVVKLQCNNTKYSLVEQTKTDKNGYFFFMPHKLTIAGSKNCRLFLVSSPSPKCSVPTNLLGGVTGASLIVSPEPPFTTPHKNQPFVLFTAGPFAFEPPKKLPCHY